MAEQAFMDAMYMVASFLILIVAMIWAYNWKTKGQFFAYMRVVMSRGKKILVPVHSLVDVYYVAAEILPKGFKFKQRDGEEAMVIVDTHNCIYQTMGVNAIDYDEVNACVWKRDVAIVPGNDPVHVGGIIKRAIESPLQKSLLIKVLVMCLVVFVLYAIVQGYISYEMWQSIANLKANVGIVQ